MKSKKNWLIGGLAALALYLWFRSNRVQLETSAGITYERIGDDFYKMVFDGDPEAQVWLDAGMETGDVPI